VAGLLHALWVVRVGGDFMHARLFLPSLFGVLLPLFVVPAPELRRQRLAWTAVLLTAVWCPVSAFLLRPAYGMYFGPHGIADERAFYVARCGVPNPVVLDDFHATRFFTDAVLLAQLASPANDAPRIVLVDAADRADGSFGPAPLS